MEDKTLAPSKVTHRDPKGRKCMSIVETQYDKAELSDEEAQRINETPGLAEMFAQFIAKNRTPKDFADKEVKSKYTYPPEYRGPKPIEKQVEILLKYFPRLDPEPTFRYMCDVYPKLVLPKWVEGPFAVPNEYALAEKFYPKVEDRPARYCSGVNLVLEKIALSRGNFYKYQGVQITPGYFGRLSRTADMIDRLIEMQKGADIIIHPMQLGMRWRGKSVQGGHKLYIRREFGGEFGEGSLEIGSVILTHHKRLSRWEELDMDCAGDQSLFDNDFNLCSSAPYFDFGGGGVRFGARSIDSYGGSYASVSGFLPE
ncbi:MAG TPA: hypothetical protein P5096_03915 [Patescibacteria group bacterium]|nr:hypothetical protein [Patescibacteria group bacterium]